MANSRSIAQFVTVAPMDAEKTNVEPARSARNAKKRISVATAGGFNLPGFTLQLFDLETEHVGLMSSCIMLPLGVIIFHCLEMGR